MTSTTDTAGHPDVEEISDLSEGLLPPSRTTHVRQHLDECPLCADVYASLEEIRGLLGTLPGPPHVPDDVAGRIDAALAAEALLNASAPERETSAEPAAAKISHTARGEEATTHVSRETAPTVDRPAGRPRASTGPGRMSKRRPKRRTTVIGAVIAIAALGFGTVLVQSGGESDGPTRNAASAAPSNFSGVKLEKRVQELLGETKTENSPGQEAFGTATTPDKSRNTVFKAEVPVCIAKGIGDVTGAIASEPGTYRGADAYLVLLPDRSDDSHVTAYVVDASCLDKASDPAGDVLLKQSYARS
ncbi:anti-sigma factor family protein [Streptomyces sp. NPDC002324]